MTTTDGTRPAGVCVPPHNLEAERSVLGAVLLAERHLATMLGDERLRPEHFTARRTRRCSPRCSRCTSSSARSTM